MVMNKGEKLSVEIICPLYNAKNYIISLNNSLLMQQNVNIKKITYILTESNDNTEKHLIDNHIEYNKITKKEFSHSLTREKYALSSEADIIVFVSQDIVIDDEYWLKKLIQPLENNEVAATYSRQLTKFNNIEKYVREYNYPEESFIKDKNSIKDLGLRTFFFSDAASAIRKDVFIKLNGYDHKDFPTNEDMYYAYKLITNNYKIKYIANSYVYHSHKFSLRSLFKRYKLTGQFFKANKYLDDYGTNNSGSKLAKYVFKRIIQEHRLGLLFRYPFDMMVRILGMKAGGR